MSGTRFVHLRLHSEFSVVDGIVRIDEAVKKAARDGQGALALTDSANLFGAVRFYATARKNGVKPIIGCDVWITHDAERDAPYRALLFAQSRAGYLRLVDWLTRAYRGNVHRGRAEFMEGTPDPACLAAVAQRDHVAAVAVDVHRVGVQVADRQLHVSSPRTSRRSASC